MIIKSIILLIFGLFGINTDQTCNCKYESKHLLLDSGVKIKYQPLQENNSTTCIVIEDKLFVAEALGSMSETKTFTIYDYALENKELVYNRSYSFETNDFIFNQLADFGVCEKLEISIKTKSGYIINYAMPFEKLNSIEFKKFMESVQNSAKPYLEEYGTKSDYLKYLYNKDN